MGKRVPHPPQKRMAAEFSKSQDPHRCITRSASQRRLSPIHEARRMYQLREVRASSDTAERRPRRPVRGYVVMLALTAGEGPFAPLARQFGGISDPMLVRMLGVYICRSQLSFTIRDRAVGVLPLSTACRSLYTTYRNESGENSQLNRALSVPRSTAVLY